MVLCVCGTLGPPVAAVLVRAFVCACKRLRERSCCGVRPRANKLRRSMSSPPDFPARHPPLFHAYTFSRAGSFVQARVPWTRSGPLLFACCQVTPPPPYRSWKQTLMRTPHSHMALGPPSSMHPTTTHPLIPAVTAAHGLFRMGCVATQLTVVGNLLPHIFFCGMRSQSRTALSSKPPSPHHT